MELKTLAMWLFRGSVLRSGQGYQIGLGDWAMGWLTRGTEESVLQVQLVPIYSGFIKFECKVKETSGTRQAWDLCQSTHRPQTSPPLQKMGQWSESRGNWSGPECNNDLLLKMGQIVTIHSHQRALTPCSHPMLIFWWIDWIILSLCVNFSM